MRSTWVPGIAAGLASATLSILSNLRHGDPHRLSAAPDLFGALVIGLAVVFVVRRTARAAEPRRQMSAAATTVLVAAIGCAVPMGLFAWQYFPSHSVELALASAVMSFVFITVLGLSATYFTLRSNTRLQPTAPARS